MDMMEKAPLVRSYSRTEQDDPCTLNVEDAPDCLPTALRYAFFIVCRYTNEKFESMQTNELCRIFNWSQLPCNETLIEDLYTIINCLKDGSFPVTRVVSNSNPEYGDFPWTAHIMPTLARAAHGILVENPRPRKVVDPDRIRYIESLVNLYLNGRPEHKERLTERTLNRFTHNTALYAPAINGTACVGKSSILYSVLDELKRFGINSGITKLNKLGGFKGKDKNELVALQCTPVMLHASETKPDWIMDRCPFNNLIWKIILALIGVPDQDLIKKAAELIDEINWNLFEMMMFYPVFIIIDSNVQENRQRMLRRGQAKVSESGQTSGDLFRCKISNYVAVQNLVYGTLAAMCDWPVVDVGVEDQFPLSGVKLTSLVQAVTLKVLNNKHRMASGAPELGSNNVQGARQPEVYHYTQSYPSELNYDAAKILNIYK